jgi:hypothetical protein
VTEESVKTPQEQFQACFGRFNNSLSPAFKAEYLRTPITDEQVQKIGSNDHDFYTSVVIAICAGSFS